MSAPSDKSLLVAGEVVGVYGVKGWLKIKSFTQPAENLFHYQPWWLASDPAGTDRREVEVDSYQSRPQGHVAHLVGLDDRDQAERLGRRLILVPSHCLPSLESGDYYWHQLIGLAVFTVQGDERKCLGRVSDIMETGANDVMVVQGDESAIDRRERLIPYVLDRYIIKVDLAAGEIWVDWDPEF